MGFVTAFGTLLEEEISLARWGNLNRIFWALGLRNFRMAPFAALVAKAVIFSGPYLYLYREFNPVNFR